MALTKRMYYCRVCKKAYIKSRFEFKTCDFCHSKCVELDVPYPAVTIAAWAILLGACIPILIYHNLDLYYKLMMAFAALGPSFILLAIGVGKMKATAEKMGEELIKKDKTKRAKKSE